MARYVVLEGIDGCGKSTQLQAVRDRLVAANLDVIRLREPTRESPHGKKLREMFEDVDEDTCQTCPFNAMNGESGCFFNYPDLIATVLPGSADDLGTDDQYIHDVYVNAIYAINRLMKVGDHDSLVFTRDETLAMFTFFWNWEPSNEAKAEKYRDYLGYIMRIMRRAVLLGKGIVIRW